MEKRYELGLIATAILTIIGAMALLFSTRYLPVRISPEAKRVEGLEKSELAERYRKLLNFEKKQEKKDEAYANLVQSFCLLFILNGGVQLYLIYKIKKEKG